MNTIGTDTSATQGTAQARFSSLYITSAEISDRLKVSRPSVLNARNRGMLPDAIVVGDNGIYIWERAGVEPFILAWDLSLKSRRGELV